MTEYSGINHEVISDMDLETFLNEGMNPDIYKPINERINIAKREPSMKQLFGEFLHSGEIMFLAGDTGAGKTLLAFQIVDCLSRGTLCLEQNNETEPQKILYFDFELSNQSLLKRYPNYTFSENFICPNVDEIFIENDGIFTIKDIINGVEIAGASLVVIDNILAIAMRSTSDGDTALQLMKDIKNFNRESKTTSIVIAHTPKIPCNVPLTLNHIAGSKILTNFADNVNIIGKSVQSLQRRYIKQLKSRNSELKETVLVMDKIFNEELKFIYNGEGDEKEHLNFDPSKEILKINNLKEIALTIIGDKSCTYAEFCNNYANKYNKSTNRGKQIHNELKGHNIIIKDENCGKWIINRNEIPF